MPYLAPKTNWGAQDGVLNDDLNRIEGNTQYLADNLNSFGVGGGSANAYTATMTPAKTSLYAGMLVRIPIMADNTGASTLKVDSLQAQPILNADGTAMAAGDLKSGGIYTFVYNGSSAFILQGKGGVSATDKQALIDINNAADANNSSIKTDLINTWNNRFANLLLAANAAWVDIKNKIANATESGVVVIPSDVDQAIPAGIYDGTIVSGKITPVQLQPGENLLFSSDTQKSSGNTTYTKVKEIKVGGMGGIVRVKFDLANSSSQTSYAQVFINGIARGTERVVTGSTFQTFSEDFAVNVNDLVQIYAKIGNYTTYVQNFRFYISYPPFVGTITL